MNTSSASWHYLASVVAVFPFQTDARKFVVVAYVMTRDMTSKHGTGLRSYDLPQATFSVTLSGLNGDAASADLYDPIDDDTIAVEISSRARDQITLKMPLTDAPRLFE